MNVVGLPWRSSVRSVLLIPVELESTLALDCGAPISPAITTVAGPALLLAWTLPTTRPVEETSTLAGPPMLVAMLLPFCPAGELTCCELKWEPSDVAVTPKFLWPPMLPTVPSTIAVAEPGPEFTFTLVAVPPAAIVTRASPPIERLSKNLSNVWTPPFVLDVSRKVDMLPPETARSAPAAPVTVTSTPPTLPAKMFCARNSPVAAVKPTVPPIRALMKPPVSV
jgi:hypothetical protein